MLDYSTPMRFFSFSSKLKLRTVISTAALQSGLIVGALACLLSLPVCAQQTESKESPVVVQPGAPGQPTKTLPPTTRAKLPPRSPKDVEFVQGMIMHHAQAVEMTALIESRTENKEIRLLGARISQSQSDEINFMKQWLVNRGEPLSPSMAGMNHSSHQHHALMPGMIYHHRGALTMVKELFETAGAGQDAELFNFATDVDSGQRAEIKIMQTLLDAKP
jgi:uncharacterized protein (DUF305 family)